MASFSVVTNIASVNAQANLEATSFGLRKALTRVSSGLRINTSGDDAAGLAIANAFRSDIAILNQGMRNANDGLSSLQIKDGAMDNISTLIDRLATQAASGHTTDSTRTTLNAEFQEILTVHTRVNGRDARLHLRFLGVREQQRHERCDLRHGVRGHDDVADNRAAESRIRGRTPGFSGPPHGHRDGPENSHWRTTWSENRP